MFEGRRIIVRYTDRRVVSGWNPRFSGDGRRVTVDDSRTGDVATVVALAGASVVLVLSTESGPPQRGPRPNPGYEVEARFDDGSVLRGTLLSVPIPGGVWLRSSLHAGDALIVFVPDGAPARVVYGSELAPPLEERTDPALESIPPRPRERD